MKGPHIVFSLHALDVLEEREISEEWVRRVIEHPAVQHPDPSDHTLVHVLGPILERDGRALRVIYNHDVEPIRVVTAYFDRTMRGKL